MNFRQSHIAAGLVCLLVFIAAFLPWATVDTAIGSVSASGTDGDGVITLLLAIIAVAAVGASAVGLRLSEGIAGVMGIAIALIGIVDWSDVAGVVDAQGLASVSVGAGLVLTTLGGVALVLCAVWMRKDRLSKAAD